MFSKMVSWGCDDELPVPNSGLQRERLYTACIIREARDEKSSIRVVDTKGKVKAIWDATAKVDDVSLHSMLLKGPDLLTPVMFPERELVISADTEEMFLQIMIHEQDRSVLVFLQSKGTDENRNQR